MKYNDFSKLITIIYLLFSIYTVSISFYYVVTYLIALISIYYVDNFTKILIELILARQKLYKKGLLKYSCFRKMS